MEGSFLVFGLRHRPEAGIRGFQGLFQGILRAAPHELDLAGLTQTADDN
jgi:hypothetical protein